MPLRTRVALFVGVATLLLSLIFVLQVFLSVRVTDQSAKRDMNVLIGAIWQKYERDEAQAQEQLIATIRRDTEILNDIFQQKSEDLADRMTEALSGFDRESRLVILVDQALNPLFVSSDQPLPTGFQPALTRMVRASDGEGYAEFDLGSGNSIYRLKIAPLRFRFGVVGYALVATPLSGLVQQFDHGMSLDVTLSMPVAPDVSAVDTGSLDAEKAVIAIADGFTHGRSLALLRVTDDPSADLAQARWLQWLSGGLVVVLVGHLLGGLVWMIKRAFAPLDAAIDVIDRLTHGEEAPPLDTSTGSIEIQRLSRAVEALRHAQANQETLHKLQAELAIASELQQALLPNAPLRAEGVILLGQMVPSQQVAGDYFDYFTIDDERVGFLIADVCGKGTPAALFMAMSRTIIRSLAMTGRPPGTVLSDANNALAESNDQNLFVTIFYAVFDRSRKTLSYANAGHVSPIIKSAAGEVAYLPATDDLVLGMIPDMTYTTTEIDLAPGSMLLCYTDGIPEAHNEHDDQFGDDRLLHLVGSLATKDPATLMQEVQTHLLTFTGNREQYDDITLCIGAFGRSASPGAD